MRTHAIVDDVEDLEQAIELLRSRIGREQHHGNPCAGLVQRLNQLVTLLGKCRPLPAWEETELCEPADHEGSACSTCHFVDDYAMTAASWGVERDSYTGEARFPVS